jgi:hypothetical protein
MWFYRTSVLVGAQINRSWAIRGLCMSKRTRIPLLNASQMSKDNFLRSFIFKVAFETNRRFSEEGAGSGELVIALENPVFR